jgi:hypothetical protein
MRIKYFTIISFCFISISLNSQDTIGVEIEKNNSILKDFREVVWGMKQSEVKALEVWKLNQSICSNADNCVQIYKGSILGDSISLWYQFLYDSLVSSSYLFYPSSTVPEPNMINNLKNSFAWLITTHLVNVGLDACYYQSFKCNSVYLDK